MCLVRPLADAVGLGPEATDDEVADEVRRQLAEMRRLLRQARVVMRTYVPYTVVLGLEETVDTYEWEGQVALLIGRAP